MKPLQMLWTFLTYGAIGLFAAWLCMVVFWRLQKWQVRRHIHHGKTIFFEPYQLEELDGNDTDPTSLRP